MGYIGYSSYEDSIFEDDSFFAKVGGGLNWVASKEVSNSFGATYSKLFGPKVSKKSLYYKFNYQTTYDSIKPYLTLKTSYSYIDYENDSSVEGADLDLILGAKKENITTLWGAGVDINGYSQLLVVDDKLSQINDFDALYSAGVIFGWRVGQKFENKYLKNLKLNLKLQGSKSNKDFKGYNVGVGVKVVKF